MNLKNIIMKEVMTTLNYVIINQALINRKVFDDLLQL